MLARLQDWFYDYYNSLYLGNDAKYQNTCQYHQLSFRHRYVSQSASSSSMIKANLHSLESAETYEFEDEISSYFHKNSLSYDDIPALKSLKDQNPEVRILRIIVMSDTHERHELLGSLPESDLIIHTGDILMRSRYYSRSFAISKYRSFTQWLHKQPATKKIVIGGNHDFHLENFSQKELDNLFSEADGMHYLCNHLLNWDGIRILATPYSNGASENRAFQSKSFNEATLRHLHTHYSKQDGIDILITHGPCETLREKFHPSMLHISGHIHAQHGVSYHRQKVRDKSTFAVAAPIMDGQFNPSQVPIILDCFLHSETS